MTTQKLRSTSKIVVEKIRGHILENLSADETTEVKEQLQNVVLGLALWYSPYERRVTPNLQDAFVQWMQGLPSELHYEFNTWNARQVLDLWFETNVYTEYADTKKYSDDKVMRLYLHLIHRELRKLMKLHDVDTKGLFV
ncbi:MAG: hypothetical protein ABS939_02655 [Psychrobacillus sp.]